jgi:hypothetical protein
MQMQGRVGPSRLPGQLNPVRRSRFALAVLAFKVGAARAKDGSFAGGSKPCLSTL